MLDLVIRGGDVVDGTGAARRRADVGIRAGRIAQIGDVDSEAASTIDASGMVVSPGFVDVHTHFDAQVFWDPALSPSPLHGVTTALAGNCGFTIAPLSDDAADGEYLMRMLARVEAMPLASLRDGVPWSWRSTAEYLDLLEGNVGPNLGVMVGHSAIRRVVMKSDANRRAATPDEVAGMARLLHEGLDAGAIGFSSSWARTHNDADGQMVPSRHATRDELLELCRVAGAHDGTSLEFIPMVGPFEDWTRELMADMSREAQRPLNWNVLVVNAANRKMVDSQLAAGDVAAERGGKVVALTLPKPFGIRMSFASGFLLDAIPGWETVMGLPTPYKRAILGDPTARAELETQRARGGGPFAALADWSRMTVFDVTADDNREHVGRLVGDIATEQGRTPWDVLCDIAVADDLVTSFGLRPPEDTDEDWKARVDVWRDGRAVIGASDAGAHLDMLATFNYTTVLLGEAVRERGLLRLEEAVQLLTDVPARLYGLVDRGRVEVGHHADLVVLDPDVVGTAEPELRRDLPAAAARLYAESRGIHHVLVNGRPIVSDGRLTSDRPGTVLRSGRDTRTPDLA